jgi:hypothetical protein
MVDVRFNIKFEVTLKNIIDDEIEVKALLEFAVTVVVDVNGTFEEFP